MLDESRLTVTAWPLIAEALATTSNHWDFDHLCGLAAGLFRRGLVDARAALYAAFEREQVDDALMAGLRIVEVDGADGFLHVARRLSAKRRSRSGYSLDAGFIERTDEVLGQGVSRRLLESAARTDPDVRNLLESARAGDSREGSMGRVAPDQPTFRAPPRTTARRQLLAETPFETVWRDINAPGLAWHAQIGILHQWGTNAPIVELRRAAVEVARASEPRVLARLLQVFANRPIPDFDDHLLQLLDHPDETVRHRAAYAFGATRHPAIRSLATARTTPSLVSGNVLRLYISNSEPGDGAEIARVLPKDGDRERRHDLADPLTRTWAEHPTLDAVAPLIWVWDRSPCSVCRRAAFQTLRSLSAVPRRIAAEATLDSDRGVREAASGGP